VRKTVCPVEFVFEKPQTAGVPTILYQEHLRLTDKSHIVDFAGHLMPLWYSSISAEHHAVRRAAGIFDCTHMGVLEVTGDYASNFLQSITTNNINQLIPGVAQYSFMLDAAGNVLDDIIVYCLSVERFIMVINAANTSKIKAYFEAIRNNRIAIDVDNPERKLEYGPVIRDMKISTAKTDSRVDIALQGPAAINVLTSLSADEESGQDIKSLEPFHFTEVFLEGIDCIVSRTGYTGAKTGFELFVHPANAPQLWAGLLEKGKPFGLLPCGLGARDCLRIEAGLPLYGHELAGSFGISPFEAGYGWAVKLEKEFFIGKTAMQQKAKTYDMKVARIELPGEKGIRPVRQNDGVLSKTGECIGWVLSCANTGENQVALVYVNKVSANENDPVGIYYLARSQNQIQQGKLQSVQKGQNLQPDITGKVISRFEKF
jgi:glycine cleavage system T protein